MSAAVTPLMPSWYTSPATTLVPNAIVAMIAAFDPASVMLYRFPALFYKTANSGCAPTSDGIELSENDIRGLKLMYPAVGPSMEAVVSRRRDLLHAVSGAPGGLESTAAGGGSAYAAHATRMLRNSLSHV